MSVAIIVKYRGPTNTKGGRWVSHDANTKTCVTLGFHSEGLLGSYSHGAATMAAAEHARRNGWSGLWVRGALDKGDTYVFVHFPGGKLSMLRDMRDEGFFIERGEDLSGSAEIFTPFFGS